MCLFRSKLFLRSIDVGFALLVFVASLGSLAKADVLFEENFDEQPNYQSSEQLNLDGWSFRRHGEDVWNVSSGDHQHHDAFEILDSNEDKSRGGTGKSFVAWRESYDRGWQNWNSDGILAKHLIDGYEELYVRFWIKFSPSFTPSGTSKLFRISSWDQGKGGVFGYGADRSNAPVVFWDFSHNENYGLRNFIALRAHPQATNYYMTNPLPRGLPRTLINGDLSLNFDNNIRDLDGDGSQENRIDRLLNLSTNSPISGVVSLDEVYGENWNKIEFYVRMNSGPGVLDGSLMQWINDELVFSNSQIPWQGAESSGGRKFNIVAIGGNDHFSAYSNELKHEEWYAIDDIVIINGKRPNLEINDSPEPPDNIVVE